jgi:bis(5'-nucleosidyl)-tetraphosphatase
MPREISAGAVIFRRARLGPEFLLLHYGLGHWDFVKGNIEKGEEEKETVRREIDEETGITRVSFLDGFRETIRYFYRWKGENIFKVVLFYLVETRQKKVTLSDEHVSCDWLSYRKALERLTFKNSRDVLKKAHKAIDEDKY